MLTKGMAVFAALAAGAMFVLAQQAATAAPSAGAHVVYRVVGGAQHADELLGSGLDVLEERSGNDLFVLGDAGTPVVVNSLGLTATVARTITTPTWPAPLVDDDTYYGGYHTVTGQYAHLDQVASAHTDLATEVTYGQSWLKEQGRGGYDLKAICLTHKQPGDCELSPSAAKPRFFLHAQIHAREITTGDVAYRWIDYLVTNYGIDDEVTKLLDSTEVWVVPIANPDGVDIVQQGGDNPILQRKNADDAVQDCGTGNTGVDLNRNAGTHFGYSGSSDDPCDETFMGPSADSEPENSALESLLTKLYPDTRADGDSAPADASTKGMFITLHSDASQVLFPWGHDSTVHTGNDASLRSFGSQLGDLLGYPSGQAGELLYDSSGGTDDWTYDKLGVPAYTIEIGDNDSGQCGGFLPVYSCQDSYFWPKLRPGLMLAAQKASNPYGS